MHATDMELRIIISHTPEQIFILDILSRMGCMLTLGWIVFAIVYYAFRGQYV
jgi:hypothetical protein